MTWEKLIEIEPRLKDLYNKARAIRRKYKKLDVFRVWCGRNGLKSEMCRLVGWEAKKPEICNCECYDLAYKKVLSALEKPKIKDTGIQKKSHGLYQF